MRSRLFRPRREPESARPQAAPVPNGNMVSPIFNRMRSDSLAIKFVSRTRRGTSFLLAAGLALVVSIVVAILWLLLLLLFAPFLLLSEVLGWRRKHGQKIGPAEDRLNQADPVRGDSCGQPEHPLIFDRRRDVSKLFGCNTRSVQYRWDIFARRLNEIKTKRTELHALDFGAGSLRDSYELIKQRFTVVSMDLEPAVMKQYFDSYDWATVSSKPMLFTESIARLAETVPAPYFDLAISFDVIEHLEKPAEYLQGLRPLLRDNGYLFAIVPNRRSIYERYFKYSLRKQTEKGLPRQPGVPHLQFKSPDEWDRFIEASGFEIVEHDMAIGTFVNDCWHGAIALPIYRWVTPVLEVLRAKVGWPADPGFLERAATPSWLMSRIDVLDNLAKQLLVRQFGWNLIVARKSKPLTAESY